MKTHIPPSVSERPCSVSLILLFAVYGVQYSRTRDELVFSWCRNLSLGKVVLDSIYAESDLYFHVLQERSWNIVI